MKLSMFLLFAGLHVAMADAIGQAKITIGIGKVTYLELFDQIKKQSGYTVVYSNNELDNKRTVDVGFEQEELKTVMDRALAGTGLTYEIMDEFVILKVQTKEEKKAVVITGKVTDQANQPLPGVAVIIKGTSLGTVTDHEGNYKLTVPTSAREFTLLFSFMGMETKEIRYAGKTTIDVTLKEDKKELDEVVVTGYQTISKERATGAYSIVSARELEQKPTSNLAQALTGLVPGLAVQSSPVNGTPRFLIRGQGTLQYSQADCDPLIVVDGFPISGYTEDSDPFATINPNDVASVTVLKDAAATSIYGARAANGVIVITTKKGKAGKKLDILADAYWSVSSRADLDYLFNMATAEHQFRLEELMHKYEPVNLTGSRDPYVMPSARRIFMSAPHSLLFERDGKKNITTEEYNAKKRELIDIANREVWKDDLNDYIFQRIVRQQYNVALRGTTDKMNYAFSASFDDEEGYLQGNGNRRALLNLMSSTRLTRNLTFDLAVNTTFCKEQTNGTSISDIKEWLSPWTRLTDNEGNYTHISTSSTVYEPILNSEVYAGKTPADWHYNPVKERQHTSNEAKTMNYRIQGGFDYKTTWGLNLSAKGQYEQRRYNRRVSYDPESFYVRDLYNTYSGPGESGLYTSYFPHGGVFSNEGHIYEAYNLRGQADYSLTKDKHAFNVLAGTEIISATTDRDPKVTRYGYNKYTNAIQTTLDYVTKRDNIFGENVRLPYEELGHLSTLEDRFFSVYANASYTYHARYSLTASFRTDASNYQSESLRDKFSPFWSVGASWLISQENFMQQASWVDLLKLRISYGIAGVAAGKSGTSSVTTVKVHPGDLIYSAGESFNTIAARGNSMLTWEKSRTFNIGMDVILFSHRLNGSIELYNKTSYDVLARTTVPVISQGTTSTTLNNAEVLNQGVEFSISTDLPIAGDLKWNATLNYAFNHNEIKGYNYTGPYLSTSPGFVVGYPIDMVTYLNPVGYTPEGYVILQGKDGARDAILDYWDTSHAMDMIIPGEGQSFHENNWVYYLGSSTPKSNLSFSNRFTWKGVTLSFMITGQLGYYVNTMDVLDANTNKASYSKQLDKAFEVYDAGYANHSSYTAPPLYNDDNYAGFQSNSGYEATMYATTYFRNNYIKGDHIRLNEVHLGYDLPERWLSKQGVFNRVKVYAQVSNLGLIWSANGKMDPNYPVKNLKPMQTFTFGVKLGFKNW